MFLSIIIIIVIIIIITTTVLLLGQCTEVIPGTRGAERNQGQPLGSWGASRRGATLEAHFLDLNKLFLVFSVVLTWKHTSVRGVVASAARGLLELDRGAARGILGPFLKIETSKPNRTANIWKGLALQQFKAPEEVLGSPKLPGLIP